MKNLNSKDLKKKQLWIVTKRGSVSSMGDAPDANKLSLIRANNPGCKFFVSFNRPMF